MSLAEAFSDLASPAADVTPASGAVDMRRIKPTRLPAPGTATTAPALPSHPSRIWVQLATGRDRSALGYDWRRISRAVEAAFKGRRPSISAWGQSNRLLAGPFESEAAANSFLGQLRRASVDGAFVWTSPAGQVVDALAVR
jgi:SPOR domain